MVLVVAITVILAIGLVMLVGIGHQIHQREPVMGCDEVYRARLSLSVAGKDI